jgi:hypothetical protein
VAGLQHDGATGNIMAFETDILAGNRQLVDKNRNTGAVFTAMLSNNVFLHHHRIRTYWHWRTRKDPGHRAWCKHLAGMTCRYGLAYGKPHARRFDVAGIDGITIHGRIGISRHIHTCLDTAGKHTS